MKSDHNRPKSTTFSRENGTNNVWTGGNECSESFLYTLYLLCIHCKNKHCRGKPLKDYIEERAVEIAGYIIEEKATVRQTAGKFGVSKSTVHKDVTDRLVHIDSALAAQARKVLDLNKSERHIRGGMATKEKYRHLHG